MLAGRSAIVTGAGRGIGAAVARLFGQHGACVLVNDLDEAAAQATANAVTAAGAKPCFLPSPCPLVLGVPSSLGSLSSKRKTPRVRGLRTFPAPPHRRTAALPHRRTAIPFAGGRAFALSGSVTEDGFPEELVAASLARHGSLEIVVNNAG